LRITPKRRRELVRRSEPKLDLRYGPGPKETLDLFVPAVGASGTFVFWHGGYWRALDKSDFSFVAEPFVARGHAVAVVNYDLCPDVSIATIVGQARRAVQWIVREGAMRGADPARIVVGGHSAGGHIAAMLYTTEWAEHGLAQDPIVGGISLSGVHDLAPLVQFSFNTDFKLDDAEAARLSPTNLQPRSRVPLLLAVGADETSEFIRQTEILWDAVAREPPPWRRQRADADPRPEPLHRRRRFRRQPNPQSLAQTLALFDRK
jgi:arylformamidase